MGRLKTSFLVLIVRVGIKPMMFWTLDWYANCHRK